MAKICYVPKDFPETRMRQITLANQVIEAYEAQGYSLTLRQIYYQFVKNNWLPNVQRSYDRLSDLLNDARLAGLIDWDSIVDRTRSLVGNQHWSHPVDVIHAAENSFALDKWADQQNYLEVWVEKDALKDIVGQTCGPLDVPYFSCRGYTSVSEVHVAALRMQGKVGLGKTVRIIHLGDHDPSGIDMTRDIINRLRNVFRVPVHVYRIALNRDQIDQYSPPPNPAKVTDSRAAAYIREHGESSWELDALEPAVLSQLIEKNVLHWRNDSAWDDAVGKETRAKQTIGAIANRWNEVLRTLQKPPTK